VVVTGNMIASLTFTYSDERKDIFRYKNNDVNDTTFRSLLDYNLYIFHNSSDQYIKESKDNKFFKDSKITVGGLKGTYPAALKNALYFLKSKGVTKLIFLQDDVFTVDKETSLYTNLVTFLKDTDLNYLNLEYFDNTDSLTPIIVEPQYNIYNTTCSYFRDKGLWSFDDSPYYSTLDYAINQIYDETYFQYPDVWSAEWHLKAKFDRGNTNRFITNKQFFRRVNFIGKHDWNKDNELIFLKENFD